VDRTVARSFEPLMRSALPPELTNKQPSMSASSVPSSTTAAARLKL
jgi:hypothetical protein